MKLSELLKYNEIVIQCHDNPDADAIASGFGLYCYFKEKEKKPRFIYSGKFPIQKSNLLLLVEELQIPIEYVKDVIKEPELLITVDCQYGEGNVTRFPARNLAVIDHHQIAGALPTLHEVRSNLGSCSTLVWDMMRQEGIEVNRNRKLATALYYGLYRDTNSFTEIYHPLDKDLRDQAVYDKNMVNKFRNSNISLDELKIAGTALLSYEYYEENRYAILRAEPCDPNILGLISDFFLEVDAVDVCLVYSVLPFGVKYSVRSCVKEVRASELAEFLAKDIGSGGGHVDKAGGFIQNELLAKTYERYRNAPEKRQLYIIMDIMRDRMEDYYAAFQVIYAREQVLDVTEMTLYKKLPVTVGYVRAAELFSVGDAVTVRTLEGDLDIIIEEETYLMIGIAGEVYPNKKEKFERSYLLSDAPFALELEYEPTVKDTVTGEVIGLMPYAHSCIATGEVEIYAGQLEKNTKVFTEWDEGKYMLGNVGDYIAVRKDDVHDIYIIEKDIFRKCYQKISLAFAK